MYTNSKRILNFVILLALVYFLFLNIKGALEEASYHYLHVDERQVIDSILNVFQINDEFNRFDFVSNKYFKNLLIVLGELVIGGNLDFGRLWNNIFVFIAGPFYLFDTSLVIVVERIIQISFFYISIIYFAYHFVNNKKTMLFLISSFSAAGVYHIIENPKPDSLLLLFLLISFKKIFKDSKYEFGFLFIGISIGLKIISIIPGILLGIYLIYPLKKITSLKNIFKTIAYTFAGVIIAQPALLIPHPKIYSRIISANVHASRYNQEKFLSLNLDNLQSWFDELSNYYNLNSWFFYVLFIIIFYEILQNFIKSENIVNNYFLISFFVTSFFILLNVERIWIYYLAVPSLFLIFYIFSLDKLRRYSSKLLATLLLIFLFNGLNTHYDKISNTFFSVDQIKEETMYKVLNFIKDEYSNENYLYNQVYWDPEYYFPRQNVTFNGNFKILENWEEGEKLKPLFSNVDFIVTKSIFSVDNNIEIKNIGDLKIYYIIDN